MSRVLSAPALFMRLVCHAGAHGAVADDANDVIFLLPEVAGDRHAEARRDRCRAVGGSESVIFALGSLGESIEPPRRRISRIRSRRPVRILCG